MEVILKPDYNECCGCIDSQILSNKRKECKECKKLKNAILHSFVFEKNKAYGIISYENGSFDTVELWRLKIADGKQND